MGIDSGLIALKEKSGGAVSPPYWRYPQFLRFAAGWLSDYLILFFYPLGRWYMCLVPYNCGHSHLEWQAMFDIKPFHLPGPEILELFKQFCCF